MDWIPIASSGEEEIGMQNFRVIFAEIPDPRDLNAQHDLTEILFIMVAASLSGADSCVGLCRIRPRQRGAAARVPDAPARHPAHDTFSRVLRHLDPQPLEAALIRFVAALGEALGQSRPGPVAVDGKRLRGAYDKGCAPMRPIVVSAYLHETRMVLAQTRAPDCSEVEGTLALLRLIALEGATVTADALHCTRQMAAALRARGADYVLTLKGNRASLAREAAALFARAGDGPPFAEVGERGHGRREHRVAWVIPAPELAERHRFKDLAALGRIESWRQQGDGPEIGESRTFVLSRLMSPRELLATVRNHWRIENNVQWELDVVFHEDACRTRKDQAPVNLALLRKIALNLLRAHPAKKSLNMKRQRAG
jgi:predicted transposase YbfD/YdcC